MADNTKIEWTDATWNPITGCTLVSEGCRNCYAAQLAATRLKNVPSRKGLARVNAEGVAKFTGEVRFNEDYLDQPLRWKRPRMIFVCAHGDLFHESVPDEWIDRVFAVMALAPHHTFQVLTKRPERMRDYVTGRKLHTADFSGMALLAAAAETLGRDVTPSALRKRWPLPNVWLGTSIEDQATADERVPLLLDTPAASRFVSAEPLLGPIDLTALSVGTLRWNALGRTKGGANGCLDWVIVGGESGPRARPMHPDWARALRDQCQAPGVSFLFKQWGEWHPWGELLANGNGNLLSFGKDPARYRHLDNGVIVSRVGKKRAGRLLDGRTWDEFPHVERMVRETPAASPAARAAPPSSVSGVNG